MSIASSGNLIDALRHTGLLNRDQLLQLATGNDVRCGEARALARQLVQRGWLTVYQANQLLLDRAQSLVIGPYQILDRLGQGGLSAVYKARHPANDWTVALKVINSEVIANAEGRQQFLLEMEAMARLDHPNIVQFCDTDQVGDTVYYAMEYVAGTDLGKYVGLTGPLPVVEACNYIRQTALGLQHAHERNLVHRDIKPVNLYLTHGQPSVKESRPSWPIPANERPQPPGPAIIKILDWGLASLRNPRGRTSFGASEPGGQGLVGTADYLSPEQARNAQTVDIRGDIYSLGCTFYYLLTGQAPFPDGTLMQKILKHQAAEPTSLFHFRDDVPLEVELILKRMMAKQPQKRFQTPAALALALLPFSRDIGLAPNTRPARPSSTVEPRNISVSDATPMPPVFGVRPESSRSRQSGQIPAAPRGS